MQSSIEINNLVIKACHGVLEFEKSEPQPFVFSGKFYLDFLSATNTDDLNKSISYCDIMQDISDFCKNNTFNLIETLAYKTALLILNKYTQIYKVDLNLKKPEAPYGLTFDSVGVNVSLSWHTVYLSLGSNLGNKEETLNKALELLDNDEIKLTNKSSFYKTQPYGGVADKEFVNMACEIKTVLSPFQLLNKIHEIEASLGRTREIHWGNRTLDIDIIFYDDIKLNTKDLIIPHKDYKNRDFVLIPLQEIAPFLDL